MQGAIHIVVPIAWALTESEARAAKFLATGLATAQIARALGLSVHTVRTQLKSAMAKAGVHTQVALVVRLYAANRPAGDGARIHELGDAR